MCDSTSQSDGLCDRCSHFLHFKGSEHGIYPETTDEDGTVHIDFKHTKDGKKIREVEPQFQLEDDYPAMTKLKRSASQGCGFCDLLSNEIQKRAPKVEENMVLLIATCLDAERDNWSDKRYIVGLSVYWKVAYLKTKRELLNLWHYERSFFRLLANHDTMAAKYLRLLHAPIHPSLFCSETLGYIQRNLSNCLKTHEECASIRPTGHSKHQALPSRLLHITKDQTGYRIRLVQMQPPISPEPETLHLKYAALSYCWGDQDFIKSTPENITSHYDTIMFSKLPPGFQDTIELCWGIEIFYLWIDSLCIIQGDQSDWDRESARMKDVYANASLTIILVSTDSPLEGLSNVSTQCSSDVRVSYRLDDSGSEITYFIHPVSEESLHRGDFGDFIGRREPSYEQSIQDSKWVNRGWTFQESYLSTRKLFICSTHTGFSCRTSSRLQGILPICQPLRDLSPFVPRARPRNWYDLVGHYSGRKLSRSEDKLPAISAVASLKGDGHGDYVAGLWTNSLEIGLLWAPRGDPGEICRALKRQTTYRGPTWSWCAYDGDVSYRIVGRGNHLTRLFDILEIRWTLAEPTAIYGRLSTGDGDRAYLKIRAKVAWVTVCTPNGGTDAVVEFGRTQWRGTELDFDVFSIDCGKTDGFERPQRVAAMLLATRSYGSNVSVLSFGLFLRPIPSLERVITYERVGCFRSDWRPYGLDIFEHIGEVQDLCLV